MASGERFKALLVADLRTLSSEARRSDSLAGQLTGWLSGPEYPAIKDAAERTLLKLLNEEDENAVDKKVSQLCIGSCTLHPINGMYTASMQ